MRGNQTYPVRREDGQGSIPACAGEPGEAGTVLELLRVDPRVCGGTTAAPPTLSANAGRSPRVRGNHMHRANPHPRRGSIPACAGEP